MRRTVLILIFTMFLFRCTSINSQQDIEKNEKNKDNSPTLSEIVWKDYDEILFLLSQKYQIDTSKVKPIITEYFRIHDPMTYFSLTIDYAEKDSTALDYILKSRESIGATVIRLSELYSIDISTLSSFIFDFKVFDRLLQIEDEIGIYPVNDNFDRDY